MPSVGLLYDPLFLRHDTGNHPESPERLLAIRDHLAATGWLDRLVSIAPRPATPEQLTRVHTPEYLTHLARAIPSAGRAHLDPDTVLSPHSLEAATLAAGGVCAAADQVMRGAVSAAFCAVRPPGHHAESGRGMGFCLYNHVAVAARDLQARHGLRRIAIIDWDVHHGNGTQEIFYRDPSVFYFSVHQYPHYPGTGRPEEEGAGEGKGFTLNVPLPAGSGDEDYLEVFRKVLRPALQKFRPEFLLISAGFDAHREDPLAQMRLTETGYYELTREILSAALESGHRRLVSVLEGGYHLQALALSVEAHLRALMEDEVLPGAQHAND